MFQKSQKLLTVLYYYVRYLKSNLNVQIYSVGQYIFRTIQQTVSRNMSAIKFEYIITSLSSSVCNISIEGVFAYFYSRNCIVTLYRVLIVRLAHNTQPQDYRISH